MKTLAFAAIAVLGVTQITLRGLTPEEAQILSHLSLEQVPDGQGGMVPTLVVTGVNVQIVNGLGQTHTANGTGNLIVGYNEPGHNGGDVRTGSHYIVFGTQSNYRGAGGMIGGEDNTVEGRGNVILSGNTNTIRESIGSVIATGSSNVIHGSTGITTGGSCFIGTGVDNRAGGYFNAIVGGRDHRALEIDTYGSVIGGGQANFIGGQYSVISGGTGRSTTLTGSWVGGMFFSPN